MNGGRSWNRVNTGLTNTYVTCLAINPSSPQILYAGTGGEGVFAITFSQPSDFNSDGKVDFDDFFLFAAAFGGRKGDPGFAEKFDLNGDGGANFDDFFMFAADFGKTTK